MREQIPDLRRRVLWKFRRRFGDRDGSELPAAEGDRARGAINDEKGQAVLPGCSQDLAPDPPEALGKAVRGRLRSGSRLRLPILRWRGLRSQRRRSILRRDEKPVEVEEALQADALIVSDAEHVPAHPLDVPIRAYALLGRLACWEGRDLCLEPRKAVLQEVAGKRGFEFAHERSKQEEVPLETILGLQRFRDQRDGVLESDVPCCLDDDHRVVVKNLECLRRHNLAVIVVRRGIEHAVKFTEDIHRVHDSYPVGIQRVLMH
jgi:hypothetical protein